MFTAHSLRSFKTPSMQRILSFGKRFSINRIDDWISTGHGCTSSYPARRAWVYFFSPSSALWNVYPVESASYSTGAEPIPLGSAKRNKKKPSVSFASLAKRAVNV
jgi:hypothetical protein